MTDKTGSSLSVSISCLLAFLLFRPSSPHSQPLCNHHPNTFQTVHLLCTPTHIHQLTFSLLPLNHESNLKILSSNLSRYLPSCNLILKSTIPFCLKRLIVHSLWIKIFVSLEYFYKVFIYLVCILLVVDSWIFIFSLFLFMKSLWSLKILFDHLPSLRWRDVVVERQFPVSVVHRHIHYLVF